MTFGHHPVGRSSNVSPTKDLFFEQSFRSLLVTEGQRNGWKLRPKDRLIRRIRSVMIRRIMKDRRWKRWPINLWSIQWIINWSSIFYLSSSTTFLINILLIPAPIITNLNLKLLLFDRRSEFEVVGVWPKVTYYWWQHEWSPIKPSV